MQLGVVYLSVFIDTLLQCSMTAIEFGHKPKMSEVPPGTEAILSFNGEPELVETKYGPKIQFPITLYSHDSYPILSDGPMDTIWETKADAGTHLYEILTDTDADLHKEVSKHYKNNTKWQLTRFDTGVYHLSIK
jgi:hypothetical protein